MKQLSLYVDDKPAPLSVEITYFGLALAGAYLVGVLAAATASHVVDEIGDRFTTWRLNRRFRKS